jgi:hypothetical protein
MRFLGVFNDAANAISECARNAGDEPAAHNGMVLWRLGDATAAFVTSRRDSFAPMIFTAAQPAPTVRDRQSGAPQPRRPSTNLLAWRIS